MSNFLDLDPEEDSPLEQPGRPNLKEMLAKVPIATAPTRLHPEISDKLAAARGFASREAAKLPKSTGGRRLVRGTPVEETRQLSIRMPVSLYNDFLAFADHERLTYNEAIRTLLDSHQTNADSKNPSSRR